MDLQNVLNSFWEHNFRPEWTLDLLRDVKILSRQGKESADHIDSLKQKAAEAVRPLIIIPVNSWYRCVGGSKPVRKNLAASLPTPHNLPVYSGVVKATYTHNTSTNRTGAMSYFVGHVPGGAHVIILDDQIGSGETVCNLAKFIDKCGAKVVGMIEYLTNEPTDFLANGIVAEDAQYSLFYGAERGIKDPNLAREKFLAECDIVSKRQEYKQYIFGLADPYLGRLGLSGAQLLCDKFFLLASAVYSGAEIEPCQDLGEAFRRVLEPIPTPEIPKVSDIHYPFELIQFIQRAKYAPKEFYLSNSPQHTVNK